MTIPNRSGVKFSFSTKAAHPSPHGIENDAITNVPVSSANPSVSTVSQSPLAEGTQSAGGFSQSTALSLEPLSSPDVEFELCSWCLRTTEQELPLAERLFDRFADTDFASPVMRNIAKCARHFIQKGEIVGASALLAYATQHKIDVGGAELLGRLVSDPITSAVDFARVEQDVAVLLEFSLKRRIRQALHDRLADLSGKNALNVVQAMADDAANLSRDTSFTKKEAEHISEVMNSVLDDLYSESESQTVLATGFADLDDQLGGGLRDGDLIVLGARPSMGKTAFSMGVARNMAFDTAHQRPVLVFSMEMKSKSLGMRMLSSESAIAASHLREGTLSDEHGNILVQVMPRFAPLQSVDQPGGCRLWIDDTPGLTLAEIRARSREFARRYGRPIILIDYLQLVKIGGDSRSHNKTNDVGDVSQGLKQLARELDTPVVALSQLNRSLEQRPNKVPVMSDLRESGQIEQDADIILFLYRDYVYNKNTFDPTEAQVIVSKQRDGRIGPVLMTFNERLVRFESRANPHY